MRCSRDVDSKRVLYVALAGNLLVAITKAAAAVVTGRNGAGRTAIGPDRRCPQVNGWPRTAWLRIGEQADPALRRSIMQIARDVSKVQNVAVVWAVQLAPEEVIAVLRVRFPDELRAPELAEQIKTIERHVKRAHPEVIGLFVKPRDS